MKKAIGQTVRDIKREVNKKVLKVPSIEQKVLDATNNETWGPHGSLLADIAQATRNYPEHQMIMTVIWKRINDTGKNWRHVYKALTVLEYLVAHGSERVIDDIKEHAYQISTLSSFQYIDSSGSDQGSNVRRKSQALVGLVNDKEKLQEARQKAVANRDKFRGRSPTGGMYKTSSYSNFGVHGDRYDEDRFDDRSSYERERECNYRDDDQYGRSGDSYGRDLDRYSRDSDERNAKDNYRDDDIRGRSQNIDEYQYGSRNGSADIERNYEDDGQNPSRMGAENQSQDSRRLDRKFSEQNLGAPPSYMESISGSRSPNIGDRDRETSAAPAVKPHSPPINGYPTESTFTPSTSEFLVKHGVESFDEFDPRSSVRGAPTPLVSTETDFLGSLSESFSSNPLAIMAAESGLGSSEANATVNSGSEPTFCAASPSSLVNQQPFDDPFGDSPFKAFPSTDTVMPTQPQPFSSPPSFDPNMNRISEFPPPNTSAPNIEFGDTNAPTQSNNVDILADILPPSGPSSHNAFAIDHQTGLSSPFAPPLYHPPAAAPGSNIFGTFDSHMVPHQTQPHVPTPVYYMENTHVPPVSQTQNKDAVQATHNNPLALAIVPKASPQDKFDPKSTVWTDTLSKGLVDLNISGAKINPLADIGIDFDAINRKDKRMEKPSSTAPATSSNVTMGKAMGLGSGIGRSGAGALRPHTNPNTMMNPGMGMGGTPNIGMGMGMGMGGAPNIGMGIGNPVMNMGYGGMNQQSIGYGGMNQQGMGMWTQGGVQMQPPTAGASGLGLVPGASGPVYNPALMGRAFGAQQPYGGGGYR